MMKMLKESYTPPIVPPYIPIITSHEDTDKEEKRVRILVVDKPKSEVVRVVTELLENDYGYSDLRFVDNHFVSAKSSAFDWDILLIGIPVAFITTLIVLWTSYVSENFNSLFNFMLIMSLGILAISIMDIIYNRVINPFETVPMIEEIRESNNKTYIRSSPYIDEIDYLIFCDKLLTKLDIKHERTYWTCSYCGVRNPVYKNKCENCGAFWK